MKFIIQIMLCFTIVGYSQNSSVFTFLKDTNCKVLDQPPEFFAMAWEQGTVLIEKETSMRVELDSLGSQHVMALINKKGDPILYASEIATPVCADGECKLMHIKLYWDLLGGYAGFDHNSGQPLTKHDHDDFLQADYEKLHLLLQDSNSILKRRAIDELVVKKRIPSKIEGVDAISGATITEVKESVVAGALYSCFKAWHLVHGDIEKELKAYTISLLTDDMLVDMLYTNIADYQLFALKKLNKNLYTEHYSRIADIFKTGIPLVRSFIVKNFSESFWDDPKLQQSLWGSFAIIDINSRSLLLRYLHKAPESVLEDISGELKVMTKNQLKAYLRHIATQKKLSKRVLDNFKEFAMIKKEAYSYLVKDFLQTYEP